MYGQRNIKMLSYTHCCNSKAKSVTYSECALVALGIQRACAILSSVVCPDVQYFSSLSHKRHDLKKSAGWA